MDAIAKMPTYEAYKDSGVEWLGEVPAHWEMSNLKRVVKEHSGNGFSIELQGQAGDVPFLKVSDLSCADVFVSTAANKVTHNMIRKQRWNIVPAGSLVTAKIGEALRKNHRKLLSQDSIIDNNCIAFECVDIQVKFNFYLHLVLDFDWFVNPGAVPSISVKKYKAEVVALPTEQEQTLIANFLDQKTAQIDEAIAIKEQQIALLKERKQIIIQKAVTQGLDPDVPMKDSGVDWIGEIPAHWEVIRLKHLFSENTRRSTTGEEVLFSLRMELGLVPHNDVSDKPIPAENLIDYKIVDKGQMVMNRMRASIGIFGLGKDYGLVSPDYAVFDVSPGVIPEYYLTFFKLPIMGTQFRLASKGMGTGSSGFMRLYTDEFGNIKVANPPKEEQVALMHFIEESEEKTSMAVEHLEGQITKLKEYKTTLINSAVTGKIRITPEMVV